MKKWQEEQSTMVVVVLVLGMGKSKWQVYEWDSEEGILRDRSKPHRMINDGEEMQKELDTYALHYVFII